MKKQILEVLKKYESIQYVDDDAFDKFVGIDESEYDDLAQELNDFFLDKANLL